MITETMADPSVAVPLPHAVEQILQRICAEQNQPPPNLSARCNLASIGEEASLHLLRTISQTKIYKTLSGFIIHMARKASPPVSPVKQARPFLSNGTPSSSRHIYQQGRECTAPNSPIPEHLIGDSTSMERGSRHSSSPQLVALGELEFRKAFLILSYIGRSRLEDVISAHEIRTLKDLPMEKFESEVWCALRQRCINVEDRRKSIDWDSGRTYLYHCQVSPDGSYTFKGPYLNKTRTHLQSVLGDDNVLNVQFEKVTDKSSLAIGSADTYSVYSKIAREGILVGLRRYQFFLFKDGGKEEKKKNPTTSPVKCFFICMESNAFSDYNTSVIKTVHEARCLFMHVHTVKTVAKYMARFSLILSKTIKLEVDLASVRVETIDDIPCRDEEGRDICNEDGETLIHTDGTGFISEDLALKCPKNLFKGKHIKTVNLEKFLGNVELEENVSELRQSESHTREPPLLIQCRLFNNGCAAKGTLLVNRKLPPGTIQIRPSMIKVETDLGLFDTRTINSLEIVGTSNQPRKTCLSRFLIALLSYGGVPKGYFMDILKNALDDVQKVRFSKRAALIASLHYGEMDDFSATRMISSGIPLDEPFLQYRLSILMNEEKKGLKGGKIPISDSYYLMGTADPSPNGLLESDQVCIILDNGQLSGNVLVYKHPGLHFGDIHVLKATYVKAMEDYVGNAKYAIFFPTKGRRSLADEMANSDFDGDMYFVSRNPQLLECFKASEPWTWSTNTGEFCDAYSKTDVLNKKPSEFSAKDLEHELFQLFLTTRFHPSETMGVAAHSWLSLMDRLLVLGDDSTEEKDCVKKNMLQLTDIYYRALDAPKSGMKVEVPKKLIAKKYPHFMEKDISSYKSTSILGQIYDEVEAFGIENVQMKDIWCLPCFDVELPRECLALWKDHYDHYRHEMAAAMRGESKDESADEAIKKYKQNKDADEVIKKYKQNKDADEVIKKYKQLLYEAADFEGSPRDTNVIFNEALAIYQVTYDHAKSQGMASYCSFAWKVAGSALCKLYMIKQDEKSIDCAVSVLREIIS